MQMRKNEPFSSIVLNNLQKERKSLSKFACKSNKGIRKYPKREQPTDRENIRPIFFHDTDKIMHSLSYSRYIDKTQVFYLFKNDHITHRVLHVQLVSKIGRVIGRCLKLNEDLIEAIALGHDLGHVPYGHEGENFLNILCKKNKIGYFCHNAQSVRFLMDIEKVGEGLNLSLQVLDGILAHNGEMITEKYHPDYGKTWERFEEEYQKCFNEENYSKNIFPMTLEGCVIRISDVIAYIGRDIEDAETLKLKTWSKIPKEITKILGSSNAEIINTLVMDLIKNSYGKDYLLFSKDVFRALEDLKTFNTKNIYDNSEIKKQTHKIKNMFTQLFNKYHEDFKREKMNPDFFKFITKDMNIDYRKKTKVARIIVDFMAGMTDDFFKNQYEKSFVPQSLGYDINQAKLLTM